MYSYSHILIPMVCIAGSSFIHSILCTKNIYPNLCPYSKKNTATSYITISDAKYYIEAKDFGNI
jgi:hypothetical protein